MKEKYDIKLILKTYMLLITIIVFLYIYISRLEISVSVNKMVIFTFIFNLVLIIFGIVKDKKRYSLNKVFWYFNLFFFFLAPLCQYLSGFSAWNYKLISSDYIKSNIALIVWNLIYLLIYEYKKENKKYDKEVANIIIKKKTVYFFVSIEIVCFLVALKLIGFSNLFHRGANEIELDISFINTIVNNFIRTVPMYTLIYSYWSYKDKKTGKIPIIISIILTIFLNYPASVTRYWIGAVYIGIVIVMFNKLLKERTFDYGLIIIFAIVFPVFQLFKWYGISDIVNGTATTELMNVYNNVDFDAYSMLARGFRYVEENHIMYGKQLFSTIMFFIPRMIWPTKSVPTGELIAVAQGQTFTNLSCPLIGEAYVNFGVVGILIYPIVFATIIKKLDMNYWNRKRSRN